MVLSIAERRKKNHIRKLMMQELLSAKTMDLQEINLEELLDKRIVDITLLVDSDGEELQIILEDGKQIEISLFDNGKIHVQTD